MKRWKESRVVGGGEGGGNKRKRRAITGQNVFPGAELLIRWSFYLFNRLEAGTVRYVLYLAITVDKTKGRLYVEMQA
jgi:hypothetical protein